MSSFMVAEQTISIVADAVFDNEDNGFFDRKGADEIKDWKTELGQELYLLNAAACSDRYREAPNCSHAIAYVYTTPFPYAPVMGPRVREVLAQRFKSVKCFLYQCSEGNLPQTPLFKRVIAAYHSLGLQVANGTPEVTAADWQ